MHYLLKPLQWIYAIYCVMTFIATMLILFPFMIIGAFFGRIRGGNIIYRLCGLWSDIWFMLIFNPVIRKYEGRYDRSKPAILVCNHNSLIDSAIIVQTFRRPARPLGKIEMSKIPVFGFIYRRVVVEVDRSSAAARARSVIRLKAILKKNVSIIVFPEGTFNTTNQPVKEFYDGAFRIAIETQIISTGCITTKYLRSRRAAAGSFTWKR
jgi:1-acyl-sn-glycerol-3-phosphate acyltransferase